MKHQICKYLLYITAITAVSACGDKSPLKQGMAADCSSAETQSLAIALIKKQTEKLLKDTAAADSNVFKLDQSKARATLENIKISIENVRTDKADPNSTKKFCKATVKYVLPADLLTTLENRSVICPRFDGQFKQLILH